MWLFYKRYYCNNTTQCKNAYRDHVYNKHYYRENEGNCKTCGKQLVEGDTKWNFLALTATAGLFLIAGIIGPYLYNILYPEALTGIDFVKKISTVTENDPAIAVTVKRYHNSDGKAFIHYRTESATAKAGEDFNAENGQLIFEPGENQQEIVIAIISDQNFGEGRESFNIQLVNVEGLPRHKVIIQDAPIDESGLKEADALVRAISGVAMDIAEYYVKNGALIKVLKSLPLSIDPSEANRFKNSFKDNESNLVRARERYIELLKDLEKIDRRAVFSAIDNWSASLKRRGFDQQQKATATMKNQLNSMLNSGIIEMDIWIKQLGDVIPKAKTDNSSLELMIWNRSLHPSGLLYLDSKA